MESTSIARMLLIIAAYVIDAFIGLFIVAIGIWFIRTIPDLPIAWMPDYYDINSTREQRIVLWNSMTEVERTHARKERVVTVAGFTLLLVAFIFGAYLIVRFIFPATIELAKNM